MPAKIPGIDAKRVRDRVLTTLSDVVQRFHQKNDIIKFHCQKLATFKIKHVLHKLRLI